jgi:bifunctional non-homologous end joining protein LigD
MPERPSLELYDKKRDFKKTREPPGKLEKSKGALRFVIQKHDASRLHYDFRLEMAGVLKSWAVPKGPSLDPKDKRMAVETEDHPIAYGSFEGTIPKGEYGGGTVLLWDNGTVEYEGEPLEMYERGNIKFALTGNKLNGRFHLVRMNKTKGERQVSWLLFKSKDEHAAEGMTVDKIPEASVKSGRSLKQIEHVGDEEGSMPSVIEPQLCQLVDEPPRGDDWIHEPKIDGYRVMVRKEGDDIALFTRKGLDWTDHFPDVAEAVRALPVANVILDGEVAVHDEQGAVQFEALQRSLSSAGSSSGESMVCYLFDCLFLEGQDLRAMPLLARKNVLFALLDELEGDARDVLLPVPHHEDGPKLLAEAAKAGLEGIVSKRKDAHYSSTRNESWRKVKAVQREEFVVVGWADSDTGPRRVGALLLARRADDGALAFAGKVGTGFTGEDKRSLHTLLASRERDASVISPRPKVSGIGKVHWVEPEVVVEVAFGSVTRDGILRHASFQGVRHDKSANDVVADRVASEPAEAPETAPPPKHKTVRAKAPAVAKTKTLPKGAIEVLGVKVSSAARVIYDDGLEVTKGELAHYIAAVAPLMLPYVAKRPLAIVRCPAGSRGQCFFQKHGGQMMPDVVNEIMVPEGSGTGDVDKMGIMVDDAAGLVGVVQMGVLEIHPWGCAPGKPDTPDRIIMDLDPAADVSWQRVCDAARMVRARLKEDGLESFVKSTGGKGLHVEFPIDPSGGKKAATWDAVKTYARELAEEMERNDPKSFTSNSRKSDRKGKIFVDYLRNGRGATAIAPYSMRARPTGTVSVPLAWDEIDDLDASSLTVLTLHARLSKQKRDPWAKYFTTKQRLP